LDRRNKISKIKLDSGCVDCGYNKHPAALEFDHLPGHTKSFGLGIGYMRSWESVLLEIAKCEIVCANCHRVRTESRRENDD
jgi:hypothetical protein